MSRVMAVIGPALVLALALAGAACTHGPIAPPEPEPPPVLESHTGFATFYGSMFHGRPTASGVPFDMHAFVAAHPTLPFGSLLRITNLLNGRVVEVRVVDRGPVRRARRAGVIVDVSRAAAQELDFIRRGRARIRLEVLTRGDASP